MAISHDSETPAVNQQVITACAFIHQKFDGVEKLFLPKRAKTKKFLPGIFELPGGHTDFGEETVDGLIREVLEEFGMNVSIGDPFFVFSYLNNVKGSHSIEVIYFARFVDPIDKITIDPEDHSEFGWFSEEQIRGEITENRKIIFTHESIDKRNSTDYELVGMLKGFELLNGSQVDFG